MDKTQEQDVWKLAVDHELVTMGRTADSFASPQEAVAAIIAWHVAVAKDRTLDEAAAEGYIDIDTLLALRKELAELEESLASENVVKDSRAKVSQEPVCLDQEECAWPACRRECVIRYPAPQAQGVAGNFEFVDVQNHRLRRALGQIMARLADLLDEDKFADIENIVTRAGVEPPSAPTYCETPCKTMCQNSVHGFCRGAPTAPAQGEPVAMDDSYIDVSVKGLQDLDTVLDRADSKGYLPDDIAKAWYELDWRPVKKDAPQPAPAVAKEGMTDEQREAIEWAADHADSYARPALGETGMMRRARALRALLGAQGE